EAVGVGAAAAGGGAEDAGLGALQPAVTRPARASDSVLCFSITLHLVIQDDRIVLRCGHRRLDRRPDSGVLGRGDPFLPELFVLELELEPVIVRRRSGALEHGAALE